MFIERHLESVIRKAAGSFPAIVITGPRQSGKTRLLREKWEGSHHFLSMEDPDIRKIAREDPRLFLSQNPPPAILDEIQYQPELLPYIKSHIDNDRNKTGQWLITGSQQFSMMKGVTESLAGRAAILNLLPLSLAEIQNREETLASHLANDNDNNRIFFTAKEELGDWLLHGGYPEFYEKPETDRRLWFGAYLQSYLERDVRNLTQVGDLGDFEKFIRLLAARTAQILHLQDVAKEVGISLPTAKRWLSVLETSFVIYLLKPYHNNFGKRLVKSPKVYFLDAGLASFLVGLHDSQHLLGSPMAGALFETAIVSELVKGYANLGFQPPLFFWRSHDNLEVDLLVEENLRLIPIEIKLSTTPSPEHTTGISKWKKLASLPEAKGMLICNAPFLKEITRNVVTYPWWMV